MVHASDTDQDPEDEATASASASGEAQPVGQPSASARVGYLVGIAVNAAMLYVVRNLPDWGWPAFLTDEFDDVLPVITLSLVASIVTGALFFWYDARWFKSLGDAVTAAIGLAATVRLFQVFPFDFSRYDFDWSPVARFVLIVVIIGTTIGLIVNAVKFLLALQRLATT